MSRFFLAFVFSLAVYDCADAWQVTGPDHDSQSCEHVVGWDRRVVWTVD